MGRIRDPNRDRAFNIYKEHEGKIKPKNLGLLIGVKANIISQWKLLDQWDIKLGLKKKKVGAPKGNKNAVNNNGGAPKGNLNGFKHGNCISHERFKSKKFLAKYLPKVTEAIMDDLQENKVSGLDMLWISIDLQFSAILRSQKIMHVSSKQNMTKELKKESWGKNNSVEYEIQFAWDKQERFIIAQAKAMAGLNKMIESYENLLYKNWDLATEEQKTRIDVLKSKLSGNDREPIKIEFVKAGVRNEGN